MKDYTITIYQDIQPNRKSSFWFNGNVATIEYKGYKFFIDAVGQVEIGGESRDIKNVETDDDLPYLEWVSNNWFGLFMFSPKNNTIEQVEIDFEDDDIEKVIKSVILSMEELIND